MFRLILAPLLLVCLTQSAFCVGADSPPHLNDKLQLVVDGKPFFIIGGELGNSTASDLESMEQYWPKFKSLHMNTVLSPVYWDRFEPKEGQFDFSLIDGLIEQARANNMRLVLLWFGTWKNSMSCYAPEWIKRDIERFPRCRDNSGKPLEILSPLSEENLDADKRAFVALMKHLKEVDGDKHTVLMVQVENEIGMIPLPRDYSDKANTAYSELVPTELFDYLESHRDSLRKTLLDQWKATDLRKEGNWEECFGPGVATEELFTAWNFARYTDQVAAAGKAEYSLPMFANAALIRKNYVPGQYPSGGPLPHLVDIWRAGAPAIDFLAPDFYFPNFVEWCEKYDIPGNAYFIPEIGLTERTPTNILYAVGQQHVMGISPFDIESIADPSTHPLGKCYEILDSLKPLILEHQGKNTMVGITPRVAYNENVTDMVQNVELGGYKLKVTCETDDMWSPTGEPKPSGSIIIATGEDEFVVAGTGTVVTFASKTHGEIVGIANIQEGSFVDGKWQGGRWLNGDQSHQGRHVRIPAGKWGIQRVRVYRYR
jgi:hypothetical protein